MVDLGKRYQPGERLGTGGMGVVYRAHDRLTRQDVALKRVLLTPDQAATPSQEDSDLRLALSREFRTLAGLRHPHVISVLDHGFDDERQPFFTMTLLENPRTILNAARGQPRAEQMRLLVEMFSALAYLHRRGIVHRDLKPANVLVENSLRVVDFGISVLVRDISTLQNAGLAGTLAYMAPELFKNEQPAPAADLFAAGVIAAEVFTGRNPFQRDNSGAIIYAIITEPPDLAGLDTPLVTVLERLLAKVPLRRYPNAETAIAALCAAAGYPLPPETAAVRESFLQSSRFVGRQHELTALTDALRRAARPASGTSPQGSGYLVGGESGVGKSRLLEELRTRALVAGALVLHGQAVAEGSPFQLWREPLRRLMLAVDVSDQEAGILKPLVPDIDALLGHPVPDLPPLEGRANLERMSLTIADLFRRCCRGAASPRAIVLLAEDLHWATESLDPLRELMRQMPDLPLLIVGTYRDDEHPTLPDDLPGMTVVKLSRFSEHAIRELSEAMLGEAGKRPAVIDLLTRETEGNAFFMVEVARALAEDAGRLSEIGRSALPETVAAGGVQQVIRRRLNRAPAWTHALLKLAAVAGRELDLKVLDAANAGTGLRPAPTEDWLIASADAAVLEIHDGRWRFAHDKLRETLRADLIPDERRDLNRQLAQAIEAAYPEDESRATVLADHWREAGEIDHMTRHARTAWAMLMNTSHFHEALALAERVLNALPVSSEPEQAGERVTFTRRAGDSHFSLGNYTEAEASYHAALELARALGDRTSEAEGLQGLGRLAQNAGDLPSARSYYEQTLALDREHGDPHHVAAALNNLGVVVMHQGDYPASRALYEEALTILREMGNRHGVASSLNNLGYVSTAIGDHRAAQRYHDEGLSIQREIGNRHGVAYALYNLGDIALFNGDYTLARSRHAEALAIRREIGDRRGAAYSLGNLGWIAMLEDDLPAARAFYEEALVLQGELGDRFGVAYSLNGLGMVAEKSELLREARTYFEDSLRVMRQIGVPYGIANALANLSFVLLKLDEPAEARRTLTESLGIAREIGAPAVALEALAGFARLVFMEGQPARAAELVALIEAHPAVTAEIRDTRLAALRAEMGTELPSGQITPPDFDATVRHFLDSGKHP